MEVEPVRNEDVSRMLERIADLLEIRGENEFKVRAYRTAAEQIDNLSRPLTDIARGEGGLRSVEGFGTAIAEKVGELLETGHLGYLEQLEAEVPTTLIPIRRLPGVGPRTAAALWREAGITTIEELDAAARSGALEGLPRIGPRSVARIVAALDARRAAGGDGGTPAGR